MTDPHRRQSYIGRTRESFNSGKIRQPSQIRLPPFNVEREAIEYFYKREKTCPSLPKRILEQVFGSDFVDRLISRAPAMKKRNCTPNQYDDLARQIRVYLRHLASAETFYARAIAMLPTKSFTTEKTPAKPRMSIFGGTRLSNALVGKGDPKKFRLAHFPAAFGHWTKGGKKVAPIDQLTFEDPMMLNQTLNITREDFNPNAPINVIKYSQKAHGFVSEEKDISQSEVIFQQIGTKLNVNSTKGKQIIAERGERYPIVNGRQMGGPRRRYNYIESIFRPQQIWQRQSYEIAVETDSMPIINFRVKVRRYCVDDLYAADLARKKADGAGEHAGKYEGMQTSLEKLPQNDVDMLEKVKQDYECQWKLNLVSIDKKIEEGRRKVADGAEWPTHLAPTKLISLEKQKSIQHIFRGLKLMEKLILQPFHRPISEDYRYFEDLLDTGRQNGSLLPLWNLRHPRLKDVKVEYAMWHPRYPDMFLCSGGRDEVCNPNIGPGQTIGFVAWFSLRNPTYPEYLQYLAKPIVSFDVHQRGYILVGGTNNGNIFYINLGVRSDGPVAETSCFDEVHTQAVCQIKFLQENAEGEIRFFSVGLEGNFREWTIEKHTIIPTRLLLSTSMPGFFHNPNWHLDQPHCVAFSPHQKNLFLIGTLLGFVHFCDFDVFRHVKHSIRAHELPVAAVRWNSFHKDVFITCGYDYRIHIFDLEGLKNGHIFKWTFDVGVRDVAWAPYNSTMFAALLTDGQLVVYDLAVSKYTPLCSQSVAITTESHPEKIRFNPWGPYILVSDRSGTVQILKLSPNLRKIVVPEQAIGPPKAKLGVSKKNQAKGAHGRYPGIDLKLEVAKLERMLAIFRDIEPPTLRLSAKPKEYIKISGESFSTKLSDGTELKLTDSLIKDTGNKISEKTNI